MLYGKPFKVLILSLYEAYSLLLKVPRRTFVRGHGVATMWNIVDDISVLTKEVQFRPRVKDVPSHAGKVPPVLSPSRFFPSMVHKYYSGKTREMPTTTTTTIKKKQP